MIYNLKKIQQNVNIMKISSENQVIQQIFK